MQKILEEYIKTSEELLTAALMCNKDPVKQDMLKFIAYYTIYCGVMQLKFFA